MQIVISHKPVKSVTHVAVVITSLAYLLWHLLPLLAGGRDRE